MNMQPKKDSGDKPEFIIRAYSTSELARLYNKNRKTVSRWLRPFEGEIGERVGRYYNARQVKIIVDKIGPPEETGED